MWRCTARHPERQVRCPDITAGKLYISATAGMTIRGHPRSSQRRLLIKHVHVRHPLLCRLEALMECRKIPSKLWETAPATNNFGAFNTQFYVISRMFSLVHFGSWPAGLTIPKIHEIITETWIGKVTLHGSFGSCTLCTNDTHLASNLWYTANSTWPRYQCVVWQWGVSLIFRRFLRAFTCLLKSRLKPGTH